MPSLREFLRELGLEAYYEILFEHGYSDLHFIASLTESELQYMAYATGSIFCTPHTQNPVMIELLSTKASRVVT
jgi:hypothetical protein